MKILVLNCGSSSIKYKLFDMTTKEVIAQGGIEKIGLKGSFLKLTLPNGEKKILEKDIPEHTVGVTAVPVLSCERYRFTAFDKATSSARVGSSDSRFHKVSNSALSDSRFSTSYTPSSTKKGLKATGASSSD